MRVRLCTEVIRSLTTDKGSAPWSYNSLILFIQGIVSPFASNLTVSRISVGSFNPIIAFTLSSVIRPSENAID